MPEDTPPLTQGKDETEGTIPWNDGINLYTTRVLPEQGKPPFDKGYHVSMEPREGGLVYVVEIVTDHQETIPPYTAEWYAVIGLVILNLELEEDES